MPSKYKSTNSLRPGICKICKSLIFINLFFLFFRCPICRVDIEAQLCPSATVRLGTLPGTGNKGPQSEPSPGSSSGAGAGPGSMDQGGPSGNAGSSYENNNIQSTNLSMNEF